MAAHQGVGWDPYAGNAAQGAAAQNAATFQPTSTASTIMCCLCGVPITANAANMCAKCISGQVDITAGIQKQVSITYCKECGRYLNPPKHWVHAELESKELLQFCIKRVRGLQKVKLVDAGFIWTEPHSRRIKTKLTVQGEALANTILQQTFVVEYVVETNMCIDCNRANTNTESWKACVQLRQHVDHKKTFFYLEQLILKHSADADCIAIKDIHEGVDFYFGSRGPALKFIGFLENVVPIRKRDDKQLVSHDTHTAQYNYKYTFSVEIAPVCREDLVCIPAKMHKNLGGMPPLLLVHRVNAAVGLLDPLSLRSTYIDTSKYWNMPFKGLRNSKNLTEYVVLDIEPERNGAKGHWCMAEAQVARASDFGVNDATCFARTHLGFVLQPGDSAWGYDLAHANLVDPELERHINKGYTVPDVILVKKSYAEKRHRRREKGVRARNFKLKTLTMEVEDNGRRNFEKEDAEREEFLENLEEDPELRSKINLYKNPDYDPVAAANAAQDDMGSSDDGGDVPEVPLDELLDALEALDVEEGEEGAQAAAADMHAAHAHDGEDMMED